MFCCEHGHYRWSQNFICFALCLTVAEICPNLWGFLNLLKILKFELFLKFSKCSNMFCCDHDYPCDPKTLISFASSLLVFLVFKFKKTMFFKTATIQSFKPNFCHKLISASFKYTCCSYKILNGFIQPFCLHVVTQFF